MNVQWCRPARGGLTVCTSAPPSLAVLQCTPGPQPCRAPARCLPQVRMLGGPRHSLALFAVQALAQHPAGHAALRSAGAEAALSRLEAARGGRGSRVEGAESISSALALFALRRPRRPLQPASMRGGAASHVSATVVHRQRASPAGRRRRRGGRCGRAPRATAPSAGAAPRARGPAGRPTSAPAASARRAAGHRMLGTLPHPTPHLLSKGPIHACLLARALRSCRAQTPGRAPPHRHPPKPPGALHGDRSLTVL
jgi:hypothetical protein